MKTLLKLLSVLLIISCSCKEEKGKDEGKENITELTTIEKGILGTWYYYSHSNSEYRCITFNKDRTACYFEISSLSSPETKENVKCFTNWHLDSNIKEGSVFNVYVKGDNTGNSFWPEYSINTLDRILRKDGKTAMIEISKINCDCN
ncbi:MAG: hypothetical protein PF485_03715 [Bacteroidales bacterium]|jgi:hypothetical protein|nr:hypothetical protein [Bacteroidales bacterium]